MYQSAIARIKVHKNRPSLASVAYDNKELFTAYTFGDLHRAGVGVVCSMCAILGPRLRVNHLHSITSLVSHWWLRGEGRPTEQADFVPLFVLCIARIPLAKASYMANFKVRMCVWGYVFHPSCQGSIYTIHYWEWSLETNNSISRVFQNHCILYFMPVCSLAHTFWNKVDHNICKSARGKKPPPKC